MTDKLPKVEFYDIGRMEKDILLLKIMMEATTNRVQQLSDEIGKMKEELEKTRE